MLPVKKLTPTLVTSEYSNTLSKLVNLESVVYQKGLDHKLMNLPQDEGEGEFIGNAPMPILPENLEYNQVAWNLSRKKPPDIEERYPKPQPIWKKTRGLKRKRLEKPQLSGESMDHSDLDDLQCDEDMKDFIASPEEANTTKAQEDNAVQACRYIMKYPDFIHEYPNGSQETKVNLNVTFNQSNTLLNVDNLNINVLPPEPHDHLVDLFKKELNESNIKRIRWLNNAYITYSKGETIGHLARKLVIRIENPNGKIPSIVDPLSPPEWRNSLVKYPSYATRMQYWLSSIKK